MSTNEPPARGSVLTPEQRAHARALAENAPPLTDEAKRYLLGVIGPAFAESRAARTKRKPA